jgi:hypothetical protein
MAMEKTVICVFTISAWSTVLHAQQPVLAGVAFDTMDTQAETFNGQFKYTVNANLATQDALTTYGGVEYASWFNSADRLCLARKPMGQSTWETIVFTDYLKTSADSHNGIAIGICPKDGTLHLAFDNHNDLLNYRCSLPGIITGAASWAQSSFLPVQHSLYAGSNFTDQFTYPRFLTTPEGDLLLQYRSWITEVNNRIAYYDGTAGAWTDEWKMVSGSGPYVDPIAGTCNSRRMYDNNLTYDAYGMLTTTFTWRENDDPAYNHDFAYMCSEDNGTTWMNNGNTVITNGNSGLAANYATPGITVVSIPPAWAMINDQGHAVDPRGGVHIVANQADQPPPVYGFTSVGYYHHHWRKADGTWLNRTLTLRGERPRLVCDAYGNLLLLYSDAGKFNIATASPRNDYETWKVLYAMDLDIGNFFSVDHVQMRESNQLNIMAQTAPAVLGDPTPLFVIRVDLDYPPDPCGTEDEACPARSYGLLPADDAYTRGGAYADEVLGITDEKILGVKYAPNAGGKLAVTYLRFQLDHYVNAGNLTKATLRLHVRNMAPSSQPTDAYRLREGSHNFWTEEVLSHNNLLKPALIDTLGVAYANSDFLEYDVTDALRQELTEDDWLTLAVEGMPGNQGHLTFHSKEVNNAAKRPMLTLEFAPNMLYPEDDAQVRGGVYADHNYGADVEMVIKENQGADYDRMAYLKFDVSAYAGTQPERVYLRLDKKAWNDQAHAAPFAAYAVADDSWQEEQITWNNRPELEDTLLDAHYGRPAMRWNVTPAFHAAMEGDGTLSLAVKSLMEGDLRNVNVYSKEFPDTTWWPRLIAVYKQALPAEQQPALLQAYAGNEATSSTERPQLADQVTVYPNPASDRFTVDLPGGSLTKVELLTTTGVWLREYRPGDNGPSGFSVSGLAPGLYLLRIHAGTGTRTRPAKLVVE